MEKKIKAIALAGPTASGKSGLALQLARRFPVEIVCMDSMQIYRGMDIGTAKPTPAEQGMVPHHMLDIRNPDEGYTVADYAEDAGKCLCEISGRGRIPVLVGGTGLYLRALMHGLNLGGTGENASLREELNAIAQTEEGKTQLHRRLELCDPESAQKLHPNDIRRVIRAIEIYEVTGVPASQAPKTTGESRYDILPICLNVPR